jgi:alkyl hydroperoxide reductase subunit AhpF
MAKVVDVKRVVALAACACIAVAAASCTRGGGGSGGGQAVAMLTEKDKKYVSSTLGGMKSEVRLVLFSRDGGDCKYCGEAEGLLADIAGAAPRVKVEVLSMQKDAARAKELGIDKVPGIAILGAKDYNLRYFGLPSGYDFTPFVETIRAVANNEPGIGGETVAALAKLTKPVQLSVFVTQH